MRLAVCWMTVAVVTLASYARAEDVALMLKPFDYQGVRLDGGPLLRQVLEAREDYLRVPNDDYLKGFRARAGKAAPGETLKGWYGDDIFHVFGQMISGLSRLAGASGDEACREKVAALLTEWGKCIEPDGFFFYSRKCNAPHYVYDKMVGGLVDAHLYARNPDALQLLAKITDWAEKNLDRANRYNDNSGGGSTEWYTLSENLYRAYRATGEERYREFAKVWEYTDYWKLYADRADIFSRAEEYHAYSHVNTLSGAAMAYLVRGDQTYRDTIVNAFDYLQQNQTFATGGYGPSERLWPADRLRDSLDALDDHFETQCGSWAAFKLSKYLLTITGDARYGDWIERLVINGIGASTPASPDGDVMYYSRYGLAGASKVHGVAPWACCAGTRMQALADFHDLVYFHDENALFVNLYAASTLRWQRPGGLVQIEQKTRFPDSPQVELTVHPASPAKFAIKLRSPAWLTGPMRIKVNGQPLSTVADERHWVAIEREWSDCDRIEIELPMGFRVERFPASSARPFPAAIVYGPVVLAFRTPDGNPVRAIDFNEPSRSLISSSGDALTFHLKCAPEVLARPYYVFRHHEPYFIYFDPARAWTRIDRARLEFEGNWSDAGDMKISAVPGASMECDFEGAGIRWIGRVFDDAGKCEIAIDGKVVAVADQYDRWRGRTFRHEIRDLPPGRHTMRLTLLAEKNPASSNTYANIVALETLLAATTQPTTQP